MTSHRERAEAIIDGVPVGIAPWLLGAIEAALRTVEQATWQQAVKQIPTTWLDSLLSGPAAILGTSPYQGTETDAAASKPYVSMVQEGQCKICGKVEDLRCGSCFQCAAFVKGEKINATTHRLWDRRNPLNTWYYVETNA